MSRRQLFLFIPIILITLSFSCKSPSGSEPIKNPREYTWEIATLTGQSIGTPQIYSIWGSSPQDVYASGFGPAGGNKGALYHFDGKLWNIISIPSANYNDFWEIKGFNSNDIWAAGAEFFSNSLSDSAVVLHYDGSKWKQMLPSHMGSRGLKSMGGTSSHDLYFGSKDGKVIHYDGSTWSVNTLYQGLSIEAIGGDETQIFAMGNTYKGTRDDSSLSFAKTISGWKLLEVQFRFDHSIDPHFGTFSIYSPSPDIVYSSDYRTVFLWQATQWVKFFNYAGVIISLNGAGPNNIFGVGYRSSPLIYHWDGTNWDEIKLPEGLIPDNVELYGVWTNGTEAFIVGNNGGLSYVLHGK